MSENTSTSSGLLEVIRSRRSLPRTKLPGAAPGTLTFEGIPRTDQVALEIHDYSDNHLDHHPGLTIPDCRQFLTKDTPTWLHVTGLHEIEKISRLAQELDIPQLYVEDILSTNGRAKIEATDDAIFIQIKLFERDPKTQTLDLQQLSIYLTNSTLITFAEGPTNIFNPLIKRLNNPSGRIRNQNLDYLLWAILDSVIDYTIASLNLLEQNLLDVDELIQQDHTAVSANELYSLKHELTSLLHLVRPNREIIHSLRQTSSSLISEELSPYLDDLHDHILALFDECQALSDYAAGMRDYLLTELNQRMNNVMKVLTCISTIFLPLTFLAGVYGMNFHHMPELSPPWAYPLIWAVFLTVGILLLLLFRKKRWL